MDVTIFYLTWLQYKYILLILVTKQSIYFIITFIITCHVSFADAVSLVDRPSRHYTARFPHFEPVIHNKNHRMNIGSTSIRYFKAVSMSYQYWSDSSWYQGCFIVCNIYDIPAFQLSPEPSCDIIYVIPWFNTDRRAYLARHCPMMSMDDDEVSNSLIIYDEVDIKKCVCVVF